MENVAFEVRRGWSRYVERKKTGLWALEEMYEAHEPEKHLEVIASVGGCVVGYLGVRDRTSHPYRIHSRGTWVVDALRGCGIATQLWALCLAESKAKTVAMFVVSDEGFTLAESLRERFPRVTWDVTLDSLRPRDLRKRVA